MRILKHRNPFPLLAVACLLAGILLPRGLTAAAEIPNEDCLLCHEDRELTKTDADGREISLFVDAELMLGSAHADVTCVSCHSTVTEEHPDGGPALQPVQCSACHADPTESYMASVHGQARQYGQPQAATCTQCHGTHTIIPRRSVDSPMHPSHLAQTCGVCHETIAAEVQGSVHGQALAAGRDDAPTCTDCHSEHRIEGLKNQSPIRVAEKTCSQCHASERLNTKYRMPHDRVRTFLGSYHGLAARLGSTRAANCASCHGVHSILPSANPDSMIHPSHLVDTCGQCHPGATENFALGRVHVDEDSQSTDLGTTLNHWVKTAYLGLIFLTVGSLGVHNGLIWWRKALRARHALHGAPERMDRWQRWQHFILALSFILLAASGFALKFPDSWLAIGLGSDESVRRWIHRVSAVVMMLLAFGHVFYVAFCGQGRRLLVDLCPRRNDLQDLLHNLHFGLGSRFAPATPAHRFSYIEKIEYWAVIWGTIIMGITGLVVWFPIETTRFLPRWAIDVATTIHYYEAILACLAILVWHIYHVVFDPDVYPLNWAFWDGRAHHGHGVGSAPQAPDRRLPVTPHPAEPEPKP